VPDKTSTTRYKQLEESGSELIELPEIPKGSDMYIGDLCDMGFGKNNGFGLAELSYSDIKDWADIKRIDLQPWEADLLHTLSRRYVEQYNKSDKPDSLSPYKTKEQELVKANDIEERLRGFARSFNNSRG
jgi:hypothetical protein